MTNAPTHSGGALAVDDRQEVQDSTVTPTPDETHDDRPYCRVVRAYCEALGWLSREPRPRGAVCCRHYWAEATADE